MPVGRALVVGGGVGGMTAALRLDSIGIATELVDIDPHWRAYGAGLTITGPSLRALADLGVIDEIRQRGFVTNGRRFVNVAGDLERHVAPAEHEPLVRCTGGILRSHLHEILSSRVRASAIGVSLGIGPAAIEDIGTAPRVSFSDGSSERYDLVVGADGIYSTVRQLIFPDASPPRLTGQGCWRVVAPRPPEIDCPEVYIGGPVKLGLVPIGADRMYMFLLEDVPHNPRYAASDLIPRLRRLMAPFGGHARDVSDGLDAASMINYRPLEWLMLPRPWYRGRVLLIGDAAHATTPHMASGAGLAVEDGLVLSAELDRAGSIEAALEAFMDRRFERARMVVENSVAIGQMEMTHRDFTRSNVMLSEGMAAIQLPY